MTQGGFDAFDPGRPLAAPRPGRGTGPVLVAVLVVFAVAALVVGTIAASMRERPASVVAGAECGPVREEPVPLDAGKHVTGAYEYDSAPPSGGPHHFSPLPSFLRVVSRENPPRYVVERAVHNLEHGYVIVWYDTDARDKEVERVADAVADTKIHKALVVPWTQGTFGGPSFVLSAWGRLQPCELPDAEAVRTFFDLYGGPNGEAPEPNGQ